MVKLSKFEHYFARYPKSKRKEYKIQETVLGIPLDLTTASGTFSPRELDKGSLALIELMRLKKKNQVLDLGTGYGLIGIMAAKMCPSCMVTMVDINQRAIGCARTNVKENLVPNTKVKQSFMFSSLKDEMFDIVLLNPPMAAGLDICYEMIEKSFDHLNKGGSLQIVARKNKGGARLAEKMDELFSNVEVLGRKSGFTVWMAIKEE